MTNDVKIIAGIIVGTLAIIIAGVFLLSRPQNASPQKYDSAILVRSDSYKMSSDSARVTLVEFSDFQCPACGVYHPLVKQLLDEFKGQITFVYRNFPLSQHKNAAKAAYSAEAAGKQGNFWEMYDLLFQNQTDWSNLDNPDDKFFEYAQSLKIDVQKFKSDFSSSEIRRRIDRDIQDGFTVRIEATPTFFLEGQKLQNPGSYDEFKKLVQDAISKSPITQTQTQKVHIHADFKVYIDDQAVDFSGKDELDPDIHLHDKNGSLIHIHKTGENLGQFFTSLKFSFPGTPKLYVNGQQLENVDYKTYVPKDLDRILLTYGSDSQSVIQKQIASVGDTACIYSEKCPERGAPPKENCVGGLGTGCD